MSTTLTPAQRKALLAFGSADARVDYSYMHATSTKALLAKGLLKAHEYGTWYTLTEEGIAAWRETFTEETVLCSVCGRRNDHVNGRGFMPSRCLGSTVDEPKRCVYPPTETEIAEQPEPDSGYAVFTAGNGKPVHLAQPKPSDDLSWCGTRAQYRHRTGTASTLEEVTCAACRTAQRKGRPRAWRS